MLTNFPVPKLYLHQITDLRTRRTIKDIVDGQQRTKAIVDYYNDEYRLSSNVELADARGCSFSQLPEALQAQFAGYGLEFDLFVGATDEEVREVFRRMNSFTVPLDPEEQRHADYQGAFKWFMRGLSRDYGEAFRAAGTLTQKALVRMKDQKLLTEISAAYFSGIATTNKQSLDRVYRDHDKEENFPVELQRDLETRARGALDRFFSWDDLYDTPLAKPHQFYALILAIMHLEEPIKYLTADFDPGDSSVAAEGTALVNLSRLAEVLELDDESVAGDLKPFFRASATMTNVGAARRTRFQWFCRALLDDLPE